MSEKTRREFLKSGALGIAGLTLGGSFLAACGGGGGGHERCGYHCGLVGGGRHRQRGYHRRCDDSSEHRVDQGGPRERSYRRAVGNGEVDLPGRGSSRSMRSTQQAAFRVVRSRPSPRTMHPTSRSLSRKRKSWCSRTRWPS